MSVEAKICGINTPAAMQAAVEGGADFIGLVFYPPSPRYVTPEQAAELAAAVPPAVVRVGLYVDAEDGVFEATVRPAGLGLLQLHGSEPPARVRALREAYGVPVMKVVRVAAADDLAAAEAYAGVADRLLFDAKPPAAMADALPGGNAISFDWRLLAGRRWPCRWMLSGGLTAANLAEAVRLSGAGAVDVSSGVEDAPGRKNAGKIAAFLAAAKRL